MTIPSWLPPIITADAFEGDYLGYFNKLYDVFEDGFIKTRPLLKMPSGSIFVGLPFLPLSEGKHDKFWHVTTKDTKKGATTEERYSNPDLRRCERVAWIRPIIDNYPDSDIKCWRNQRNSNRNILLLLESERYLVVIVDRRSYVFLQTAYYVEREHTMEKLLAEYEESEKC